MIKINVWIVHEAKRRNGWAGATKSGHIEMFSMRCANIRQFISIGDRAFFCGAYLLHLFTPWLDFTLCVFVEHSRRNHVWSVSIASIERLICVLFLRCVYLHLSAFSSAALIRLVCCILRLLDYFVAKRALAFRSRAHKLSQEFAHRIYHTHTHKTSNHREERKIIKIYSNNCTVGRNLCFFNFFALVKVKAC